MARSSAMLEPRAAVTLDDYVRDLGWSADGRWLAVAGGEGRVFRIDVDGSGLTARELGAHLAGTLALAMAPLAGRFATSGQDGTLALWDGSGGAELRRWRPTARAWTEQLAWSPDGGLLASAAGRRVTLWSAEGEPLGDLPAHPSTVVALGWEKSGRALGAAYGNGVRVQRIDRPLSRPAAPTPSPTPGATREYPAEAACLTLAFSPNGKLLATGTQAGSVHFWYLGTGRNSTMSGYGARVALTAWSANSRYLATASAGEIVVWDFAGKGPEGTRPARLTGHTARVESLAWQPGGPHLASGGRDWRLSLWLPGKATQAIDAHMADGEVTVVRWSPDGRQVAVGGAQGAVALYELVTTA